MDIEVPIPQRPTIPEKPSTVELIKKNDITKTEPPPIPKKFVSKLEENQNITNNDSLVHKNHPTSENIRPESLTLTDDQLPQTSNLNLTNESLVPLDGIIRDDINDETLSAADFIETAYDHYLFKKYSLKASSKRENVINEILTSEQSYLKSLILMNEAYRRPMLIASKKKEISSLTQNDVDLIFSKHFRQLLRVNLTLLHYIISRIETWSSTQFFGDLFLHFLPFLKVYTHYTGGWESSITKIEEIEGKDEFEQFLQKCSLAFPNLQNLRSYLIMPIQRIPRYRLLIQELIEETGPDHPDYTNLKIALEKVMIVANQADLAINEAKNREKLIKIQKKFIESVQIFQPGRVFIKKGELTKICRKDHKKFQFFLFTDMLMYAKDMPGGMLTRPRIYRLDSLIVKDVPIDKTKILNAIQISSNKKSFLIYSNSHEEKMVWINNIEKCIKVIEEKENNDHYKSRNVSSLAPVWVPDSECNTCVICDIKFTFLERRHHCRQCGLIICGKCSSKKKKIPGKDKKKRVCDMCFVVPFPETQ